MEEIATSKLKEAKAHKTRRSRRSARLANGSGHRKIALNIGKKKAVYFINCQQCIDGDLVDRPLMVCPRSGRIVEQNSVSECKVIDLKGGIIAPGFLELQINGLLGFHFTSLVDEEQYRLQLRRVASYLVRTGVTAFWVTIPTVTAADFRRILPLLKPRAWPESAELLGAHVEGPYLATSRKGAHNSDLFRDGASPLADVYGTGNLGSIVKMATVAPEVAGGLGLISELSGQGIRVSLGHSAADYDTGLAGLRAGANMLTHVFNAMEPLHHRSPGLAGLMGSHDEPYYSIIADGIHVHPTVQTMAYRTNPRRCILITDAIELTGLADGVHPGHAQIPLPQRKAGNRVTIEGTETLIGSCSGLDDCVRNLMRGSNCSLAEAVRCVTENIAQMMGLKDRGVLEVGRCADFVVLSSIGEVMQTWVSGQRVYQTEK